MAALVIGVPKEMTYHGHDVVVQASAGSGCGFPDGEYVAAGARVVGTAAEVFAAADLIVKVKEPVPEEYDRFRSGQQLFTYLDLAGEGSSPSFSSTGASTRSPTRRCRPRTGGAAANADE